MTTPDNSGSPPAVTLSDEQLRAASRKKLLWIFALFFIPLLMAVIWLQVVRAGGGIWGNTSRGELISPAVPLEDFSLAELNADEPFVLDDVRGKWTILYVPGGPCIETCQETLHNIRQARLALNNRMLRVQRALLLAPGESLSAELLEYHQGLRIVSGDEAAIAELQQQIDAAQATLEPHADLVYLIDPLGNLMMRYTPDKLPKPLFKDLKHLLKVSRIG